MALLNLQASYFSFGNPLHAIDRWLHRPRHRQVILLQGREVEIEWSGRAEDALRRRDSILYVELRLYFSCVIKKQVFFHERDEFPATRVNERLAVCFRPLTSAACDPRELAATYPVGRDLSDGVAARMLPRRVTLDYRAGRWQGRFAY